MIRDKFLEIFRDIFKCSRFIKNQNALDVTCPGYYSLNFRNVSTTDVMKKLRQLDIGKATGYDKIPAKLVKITAPKIVSSLTRLINKCIKDSVFPDSLKYADILPCFKAKEDHLKENYRPISILPIFSKIFEKLLNDQLRDYFDTILSKLLSAFRKNYSLQAVLLKMIDDWKKALDNGKTVGVVMIDLSKAFDIIPHLYLLAKLENYGLSQNAMLLMKSYLSNRHQRVKIGNSYSDWSEVKCGVPQGSILGPLLFNIFVNDMFYVIENCDMYNYADDNTMGDCNDNVHDLIKNVESDLSNLLAWFIANCMTAHPEKFQCMTMGKLANQISFHIDGRILSPSTSVKVLGITIDDKLLFREHVRIICQKAAKQLNVLKRLHRYLNFESRMAIYRSFIMSNFTYCPLVWHFCSIEQSRLIEKLQERALRFVYNDFSSSYTALLLRGDHQTLYISRLKTMAIEVYKALHGLCPEYISDLITLKENKYELRSSIRLIQPKCNSVTHGLYSFSYKAPKIWNDLPEECKNAVTLKEFKNIIKMWNGPKCLCNMCSKLL